MNRRTFALAGLALLPPTVATTAALAKRTARDADGHRTTKKRRPKTKIVTRTFRNGQQIRIPGLDTFGPAAPYPSSINVSGLTKGRILDLTLKLDEFSHTFPFDVDILLVAPDGRAAIVMSDTGLAGSVTGLVIRLDDQAATPLPKETKLTSGTFQPTNYDGSSDDFPAPAPQGVTTTALSVFRGAKPSGRWQLFVADHAGGDVGRISDGWSLTIKARIRTRT